MSGAACAHIALPRVCPAVVVQGGPPADRGRSRAPRHFPVVLRAATLYKEQARKRRVLVVVIVRVRDRVRACVRVWERVWERVCVCASERACVGACACERVCEAPATLPHLHVDLIRSAGPRRAEVRRKRREAPGRCAAGPGGMSRSDRRGHGR